ncbi:PREDICTED: vacuolar cation/proton exchanger 5-like isoform X1 [Fragaria vesca subsp. vesca]|uniref:vacuolar cation/proton exchanger 5-like isoform X1 n=2 Tax=Fragaria vesca subsp. vesca TaxID=101020 RepID=UPI0002C304AC|nr:PREDICTED: vacuolar cation/proton exchanger 5-like isoform X1 [Fragaria vesca subsp. vesca]XP_011461576.1 PREDICTED: vacuolar cation/proton exchanger 5-like isoform X1 [Fragaria vesca subsp. vesca]
MSYKLPVEMESKDNESLHEFEDEILSIPEMKGQKSQPIQALGEGSFSGGLQARGNKMWRNAVCKSIKTVVFSNKLNMLMPFGPLAIFVHIFTGHNGWVFFLTLLGITPLAERLGYATEQLAFYTGPTVGGLLNATFGNATELIISIYALKHGMLRVVQQSLLGSILSNMLLVLGCAFFSGGLVFQEKEQVFDKATAVMNSGLLLMAVMGLLFPAVLHFTHTEVHFGKSELALSRFSSCIMLLAYATYLFYQLKSQKNQYVPLNEEGAQNEENSDDDDETPEISKWESIIWLVIMTSWISFLSEYLVNAIEGASVSWKIPISFISVILLPIVGNAAEHASAVMFAMKDKLDISLGVAIGSSTQISMFGIPFCVVIGWIMGRPMDLNFQLFETATLFITVLVVAFLLQDGTSNYFKGLMLILCYLIVAASFFVHVDPSAADAGLKP